MKIHHLIQLFLLFLLLQVSTANATTKATKHIKDGYKNIKGQKIYYKIVGDSKNPPLVMVHGGPGFDHNHMLSLNPLAENYQLIYYDQRGSGASSGKISSDSITMQNFVADLEELRRAFNIKKMDVVATSFGGLVALYYSIKNPQHINSLVLVASVPAALKLFDPVGKNIEARTSKQDKIKMEKIEKSDDYKKQLTSTIQEYYRIFFKAYLSDPTLADKINLEFGPNTIKNMDQINPLMYESLGDFDIHPQLNKITAPVLVLHGDIDPFPYQAVKKIHQTLPNSNYILYKNTGHFLYLEQPKQLFIDIRHFLKKNIKPTT